MACDFETDPELDEELAWTRELVRDEVVPPSQLEPVGGGRFLAQVTTSGSAADGWWS